MSTREHSIATWCKRFQIDLWNLHDRMKAGELILYEKRGEDERTSDGSSVVQDGLLQAIGIARLKEVRAEADRILSGMLSVGFRVSENESLAAPTIVIGAQLLSILQIGIDECNEALTSEARLVSRMDDPRGQFAQS
jgi:hypothetical protein